MLARSLYRLGTRVLYGFTAYYGLVYAVRARTVYVHVFCTKRANTSFGFVTRTKKHAAAGRAAGGPGPRARPRRTTYSALASAHTTHRGYPAWLSGAQCGVNRIHSFHATQVWPKPCLERRDLGAAPPPAGSISAQYAENNAYLASAVVKASNAVRAVKSALCSPSSESSIMPGLPTGKPGRQQRPVTPRSTCQVCPLAWVTDIEPTTSSPLDRT